MVGCGNYVVIPIENDCCLADGKDSCLGEDLFRGIVIQVIIYSFRTT